MFKNKTNSDLLPNSYIYLSKFVHRSKNTFFKVIICVSDIFPKVFSVGRIFHSSYFILVISTEMVNFNHIQECIY